MTDVNVPTERKKENKFEKNFFHIASRQVNVILVFTRILTIWILHVKCYLKSISSDWRLLAALPPLTQPLTDCHEGRP
jgi:hypothetical protein